MTDLSGKVVAITGGASGIGLACARACIDAGAKVAIIDRNATALEEVRAELGAQAVPIVTDLMDKASVAQMLDRKSVV